jgi:membrane associated rhomboid family serine protease
MKTIKSYIANLPKGVKWIVGINIFVYLLFLITNNLIGVKLHNYFGVYPTYSDNFNPIQIVSSMFVHKLDISHLFGNMLVFLIFAPFIEKKFGTKFFIFTYLICGVFAYTFINYSYLKNKPTIEQSIIKVGVNVEDIKITNHSIDENYLSKLNRVQRNKVLDYQYVISKSYGASGAIGGMILIYMLFNIKNLKKILYILLGSYIVYLTMDGINQNNTLLNGSHYAHAGGMFGGLIIYLFYKTKKGTK